MASTEKKVGYLPMNEMKQVHINRIVKNNVKEFSVTRSKFGDNHNDSQDPSLSNHVGGSVMVQGTRRIPGTSMGLITNIKAQQSMSMKVSS
jgi:hypothetical protein